VQAANDVPQVSDPRRLSPTVVLHGAQVGGNVVDFRLRRFISNHNLPGRPVLTLPVGEKLKKVCIWGIPNLSLPNAYDLLSNYLKRRPVKIRKVTQRSDSRIRFDISVPESFISEAIRLLCRRKQRGWLVKEYVPYHLRIARQSRQPQNNDNAPNGYRKNDNKSRGQQITGHSLRIATLNIFGYDRKRADVEYFVQKERIDVLGLQETLKTDKSWPLRLHGFQCIESPSVDGVGRGVALAVRKGLSVCNVGSPSTFWSFGRIVGNGVTGDVIVGSVYVPCSSSGSRGLKRRVINAIKSEVSRLRRKYPNDRIIVMGDFNTPLNSISRICERTNNNNGLPLPIPITGSSTTFHRARMSSDIDHICADRILEGKAKVLKWWDLSDHWPVMAVFNKTLPSNISANKPSDGDNNDNQQDGNKVPTLRKIDGTRTRAKSSEILLHNRWQHLSVELGMEDNNVLEVEQLDRTVNKFISTSNDIATDLKLRSILRDRSSYLLTKEAKQAIKERLACYNNLRRQNNVTEEEVEEYLQLRKVARKEVQKAKLNAFRSRLKTAILSGNAGSSRNLWKWVDSMLRPASSSNTIQPVKDVNNELVTDVSDILNAWSNHYEFLAKDVTGHSKMEAYWYTRNGEQYDPDNDDNINPLPNINQDISWSEIVAVLVKMKNGKAPGSDGLPSEWYKVLIDASVDESGDPVPSMSKIVLKIIRLMWTASKIPEALSRALVVSLPKKGDMTDMNNYRGISLINVLLKTLCSIVIHRIGVAVEGLGIIVREQAGFRPKEECLGQVAALIEIARRRFLDDHNGADTKCTYTCFVDFQKAYDTVPHGALLYKLRKIGIVGRSLNFIRSLYTKPMASVRLPFGMSKEFELQRGLRQGCPMSPTLFDLFINDIFDDSRMLGVRVPGLNFSTKIPGLLFADDVALLAAETSLLQAMMDAVGDWADRWEMKIGASKCGVLVFYGDNEALKSVDWKMQGESIPVVDQYTYLGVVLDPMLTMDAAIKYRSEKMHSAMMALRTILTSKRIPTQVKIMVFKSKVIPCMTYGSEVMGNNKSLYNSAQSLVNKGLRWIVGTSSSNRTMSNNALWTELNIAPLEATVRSRRIRLWKKLPQLKTWSSVLISTSFTNASRTWLTGTKTWLLTQAKPVSDYVLDESTSATDASIRLKEFLWEKHTSGERAEDVDAWKTYKAYNLKNTSKYLSLNLASYEKAVIDGIRILSCMRLGGYWTGAKLSAAGLIDRNTYRSCCPMCRANEKENLTHIILKCSVHANARQNIQYILDADKVRQLEDIDITYLCLGGDKLNRLDYLEATGWKFTDNQLDERFIAIIKFLTDAHIERSKILNRLGRD
jgi:hypothetical protein